MPRLSLSEIEKRRKYFSSEIVRLMHFNSKTNAEMARYLGMSERSFISKKQAPQHFRLGEIELIAKLFNVSISTLLSPLSATA